MSGEVSEVVEWAVRYDDGFVESCYDEAQARSIAESDAIRYVRSDSGAIDALVPVAVSRVRTTRLGPWTPAEGDQT